MTMAITLQPHDAHESALPVVGDQVAVVAIGQTFGLADFTQLRTASVASVIKVNGTGVMWLLSADETTAVALKHRQAWRLVDEIPIFARHNVDAGGMVSSILGGWWTAFSAPGGLHTTVVALGFQVPRP